MIQNYFQNVKTFLGNFNITAHAWAGCGKCSLLFLYLKIYPLSLRRRRDQGGKRG